MAALLKPALELEAISSDVWQMEAIRAFHPEWLSSDSYSLWAGFCCQVAGLSWPELLCCWHLARWHQACQVRVPSHLARMWPRCAWNHVGPEQMIPSQFGTTADTDGPLLPRLKQEGKGDGEKKKRVQMSLTSLPSATMCGGNILIPILWYQTLLLSEPHWLAVKPLTDWSTSNLC